jgi:hypothetical protein
MNNERKLLIEFLRSLKGKTIDDVRVEKHYRLKDFLESVEVTVEGKAITFFAHLDVDQEALDVEIRNV